MNKLLIGPNRATNWYSLSHSNTPHEKNTEEKSTLSRSIGKVLVTRKRNWCWNLIKTKSLLRMVSTPLNLLSSKVKNYIIIPETNKGLGSVKADRTHHKWKLYWIKDRMVLFLELLPYKLPQQWNLCPTNGTMNIEDAKVFFVDTTRHCLVCCHSR